MTESKKNSGTVCNERKRQRVQDIASVMRDKGFYVPQEATTPMILEKAKEAIMSSEYAFNATVYCSSLYALYTYYGMEDCILWRLSWIYWIMGNAVIPALDKVAGLRNQLQQFAAADPQQVGGMEAGNFFGQHFENFTPLLVYLQVGSALEQSVERLTFAGVPFIVRSETEAISDGVMRLIGNTRHKKGLGILRELIFSEIMKVPHNMFQVANDASTNSVSLTRDMWLGPCHKRPHALVVPCVQPFLRHCYDISTSSNAGMHVVVLRIPLLQCSPELSVYYRGKEVVHPNVFQLDRLPIVVIIVIDDYDQLNNIQNWHVRNPVNASAVAVSGIAVSRYITNSDAAVLLLGTNFYVLEGYYPRSKMIVDVLSPIEDSNWIPIKWSDPSLETASPKLSILTPECAIIYGATVSLLHGYVRIKAPFNFGPERRALQGESIWKSSCPLPTAPTRLCNMAPHIHLPPQSQMVASLPQF